MSAFTNNASDDVASTDRVGNGDASDNHRIHGNPTPALASPVDGRGIETGINMLPGYNGRTIPLVL